MSVDDEEVRLAVYRTFATTGAAPACDDIASAVGTDSDAVRASLRRLAAARHLVLDGNTIVMAHPFSAIPLGFVVMGTSTLWWGGCAWDSFGIVAALDEELEILTRCAGCGA